MKKRNGRVCAGALALVLAALLCVCMGITGCGGSYTEAEIRAALDELLPQAAALNEIYFGEGLPVSRDPARVEAFYATFAKATPALNYSPVDESCAYQSAAALREATLAVFTEEYAAVLFERAFDGIDAVYNENTEEQLTQTVTHPRYLEQNGFLTVRLNLAEEAIALGRTYDTASLRLLRQNKSKNSIVAVVPSFVDGKEDVEVRLKLVKTESGFRLDSPTY